MNPALTGIAWGSAFVLLESVQFVFFGGLFQHMNSFLFGALVFLVVTIAFVGWSAVTNPEGLKRALQQPVLLLKINLTATLAWIAFLGSVQLIEPAVAYTIGAGVMPMTTYIAYRCGVPEGEDLRNRREHYGNLILLAALVFLVLATLAGYTGFVRTSAGSWHSYQALLGVTLAVADGALFTWLLIYCQRLDRKGVPAGTVFGLRFPLYVVVAGLFAGAGVGVQSTLTSVEIVTTVALGILLIVPPLYALQRAVALISTLTLSTLTALGPFVIFILQMVEGRVDHSSVTLAGLALYFTGAMLATWGAVNATTR